MFSCLEKERHFPNDYPDGDLSERREENVVIEGHETDSI
jgi:hypothetical protein